MDRKLVEYLDSTSARKTVFFGVGLFDFNSGNLPQLNFEEEKTVSVLTNKNGPET
jgi:hypothetical protein